MFGRDALGVRPANAAQSRQLLLYGCLDVVSQRLGVLHGFANAAMLFRLLSCIHVFNFAAAHVISSLAAGGYECKSECSPANNPQ